MPAETRLLDSNQNVLRRSQFYYDQAADLAAPPERGDLTRQRAWIEGNEWAETRTTYDPRGNPRRVIDANGRQTTTVYDDHDLLPVEVS